MVFPITVSGCWASFSLSSWWDHNLEGHNFCPLMVLCFFLWRAISLWDALERLKRFYNMLCADGGVSGQLRNPQVNVTYRSQLSITPLREYSVYVPTNIPILWLSRHCIIFKVKIKGAIDWGSEIWGYGKFYCEIFTTPQTHLYADQWEGKYIKYRWGWDFLCVPENSCGSHWPLGEITCELELLPF